MSNSGKKTARRALLAITAFIFAITFVAALALGFVHLALWYQQPRFVNDLGQTTVSLGFLITAMFFFGGSLLSLAISAFLLILLLTRRRSRGKGGPRS